MAVLRFTSIRVKLAKAVAFIRKLAGQERSKSYNVTGISVTTTQDLIEWNTTD